MKCMEYSVSTIIIMSFIVHYDHFPNSHHSWLLSLHYLKIDKYKYKILENRNTSKNILNKSITSHKKNVVFFCSLLTSISKSITYILEKKSTGGNLNYFHSTLISTLLNTVPSQTSLPLLDIKRKEARLMFNLF